MGLDGCGQMCKCILILFNIFLALVGIAMLGLGLWLRFSSETRGLFDIDFNTQEFVIGVTGLIVLGGVLLVVAVVGDYGACNEKRGCLALFSCLLGILAGILLGVGVVFYLKRDEVSARLALFYASVYAHYADKGDPAMALTLSIFHNTLGCCGVVGALDLIVKKTCPDHTFLQTFTMPSCPPVIINLFQEKAPLVMGLFLGTAALLVTAMVFSSLLRKEILRSRSTPATYVLLTPPATPFSAPPAAPHPHPHPHPYQDPVVFTPLTIPMTADDATGV